VIIHRREHSSIDEFVRGNALGKTHLKHRRSKGWQFENPRKNSKVGSN